jgi:hypothetical protein
VCHRSTCLPEAIVGHPAGVGLCRWPLWLLALSRSQHNRLRLRGRGAIATAQTGRGPRPNGPPGRRATGPPGACRIPPALARTPCVASKHAGSDPIAAPRAGPLGARPISGGSRPSSDPHRRHTSAGKHMAVPSPPPSARLQRLAHARRAHGQTRHVLPGVEALQALRGVPGTGTVTRVAARGAWSRFDTPSVLMQCGGRTPSEYVTGVRRPPGAMTKAGHTPAQRARGDSAWAARSPECRV